MAEPEVKPEPDYESMSEEELVSTLFGEDRPSSFVQAEDTPETEEPAVEPTPEPEPKPETPAEEPPPEPPPDIDILEREARDLRERELREKLELLEAHNSRLAGKIGFLENKLKDAPPRTEPEFRTDSDVPSDDLETVRREIRALRQEREAEKFSVGIAEEMASAKARYAAANYTDEEIRTAAERFAPMWQEALDSADVNTARKLAKAVTASVATEIETRRLEAKIKAARELHAASVATRTEAKKAATISGSGAAPTPPSRPKQPEDMTPEELAKEIWG